ncbi:alpha/beta hydrolase [Flavilitoribacter nigricans]|nr:alpha/beta hydrolase [Flavilitoribacter nigricans]
MENSTLQWTTSDGLKIFGKCWPVEQPKAVLNIAHGMGEHIQRYEHVAAFYNRHNIAVIGNDHRGHGLSEGKKGHIPEYSALLDEMDQLLEQSRQRFPGVPQFLFGQSLGGNIVLNYALRRQPQLAGVIASSPWIQLEFRPNPVSVMAGKLLKNLYPTFSQPTDLKPEHLSTDPEVGRIYQADPLVHSRITAAMGTEMLDAADYLHQYSGKFPLPLLIMHGTEDHIISFDASRQFAERVDGPVTFIPWKGLYHELHNETRQEEVLNTSLQWVQEHL